MLRRILNLFLYAGLDKESHEKIRNEINQNNGTNIKGFSLIAMLTFLCITVYASFSKNDIRANIPSYVFSFCFFLILFITVQLFSKKHPVVTTVCVYSFITVLLGFGMYMGLVLSPNQATVSFIAILTVLPGLFYLMPLCLTIVILTAVITYISLAVNIQSGKILTANLVNSSVYGSLSIAMGIYIMTIRASKFNNDRINRFLSTTDQMTGLGNRRKYEAKLDRLRESQLPTTVITFDINNLKKTNDSMGHKAGDELIMGAVSCIQGTFGKYGECYRTGGDEFVVIASNLTNDREQLEKVFSDTVEAWHGNSVEKLSISYGLISSTEHPELTLDELILESDRLMYEAKAKYYREMNVERYRK